MKSVILAGGYGTRLYPITLRTPKALLPIAGTPLILHAIGSLAKSGVTGVIVSIREDQLKIAECLGDGKESGSRITYVYEPAASEEGKLGSVGALEYVFSKMGEPTECFVVGGDNYFHGLDFRKLKAFHAQKRAHATIALYDVGDREKASHYGVVVVDRSGRITKFVEKPSPGEAPSTLASTAAYYLADDFLCERLPEYCGRQRRSGRRADRIGDLWEHYLHDLHLYGYAFKGYWGDVGNAGNYLETNAVALSFTKTKMGKNVSIHPSAKVRGPVFLGDDVEVGANAVVGPNATILHHSVVSANAAVVDSIVFERVSIGANAAVENSIVDGCSSIGENVRVRNSSVGYKAAVGNSSQTTASRVFPFQSIAGKTVVENEAVGKETELSGRQKKELEESCYWL